MPWPYSACGRIVRLERWGKTIGVAVAIKAYRLDVQSRDGMGARTPAAPYTGIVASLMPEHRVARGMIAQVHVGRDGSRANGHLVSDLFGRGFYTVLSW